MAGGLSLWNRKLHRWGAIAASVPILIIICSGILLQLKKESAWIQPATQGGTGDIPTISFEQILRSTSEVPEAAVTDWPDIQRIDVRPDHGVAKVWCANGWEVQIDTRTGGVLQTAELIGTR